MAAAAFSLSAHTHQVAPWEAPLGLFARVSEVPCWDKLSVVSTSTSLCLKAMYVISFFFFVV